MAIAGDVFDAVRALVDDDEGDIATDKKLVPLLQMAQEVLVLKLVKNPNVGRFLLPVEVFAVAAGTTSLAPFFNPGGPLEGLTEIAGMREKPAGSDPSQYVPMTPLDDLPIQAQNPFYNYWYVLGEDDIRILGSQQAEDFRVFGAFNPKKIIDANTRLAPGTILPLKLKTAALYCGARGNPTLKADMEAQWEDAYDELFNSIILEKQLVVYRQRPYSSQLYNDMFGYLE